MTQKTNIVITPDAKNNQVIIKLQGEITLANINSLKRDILAVIKQYEIIKVEVKDVKTVDLACVQLLHALKKSTIAYNQTLVLDIELPDNIKELLKNAGIDLSELV